MHALKIIAIIPARGGSKGIPRKNVYLVAGKPLLAHSIEHALQTHAITRTIVSTDDDEIGTIASDYGAEVVWRPSDISGDSASSESALLHVLNHLQEVESYTPDLVVFLQATSPIRLKDDVKKAIEQFIIEDVDSMLSVNTFHVFVWRKDFSGVKALNYDSRYRPLRQNKPDDYIENGSFYIFKPWVLRQYNNRLGGKIALYHMQDMRSFFAVDEPGDIEIIEALMRHHQST